MVRGSAKTQDVHDIAMRLPESAQAAAWGDRPAYQVNGKNFIIFRGPRKDAVDVETGELLTDVIMFSCPSEEDKLALVQNEATPFFTTPHFNGYSAVLLREAHVGQLSRNELGEVITDAWLTRAPKRLAKQWLER